MVISLDHFVIEAHEGSSMPFFFSRSNPHEFPHALFRSRLPNNPHPVNPNLLTASVAVHHKHNQRGDILEVNKAKLQLGGSSLFNPILCIEGNDLGGRNILDSIE